MLNTTRYIFWITVLLLTALPLESPAQGRRLARADKAFELKQYSDAIELYQRAYNRVRRRDREEAARVVFQIALCHKYLNNHRAAEAWFNRAVRSNYPDPRARLLFAEALMNNGKYEEAQEQFTRYLEAKPDDWRGQRGLAAAGKAMVLKDELEDYQVEAVRMFNSRQDDFTPAFADQRANSLIFASSRDEAFGRGTDPWTGNKHSSFFIAYKDRTGAWGRPSLLDEGPINTEFNEGAPSVNRSGTEMYFTRCTRGADADMGCRIFVARRDGAQWVNPREINLTDDSLTTVGHPAISPDELTLYFVSDMEGSIGEMDIWMVQRNSPGGEFGKPENLGEPVNTPGNEMFPYVREDGTLFFSSDGHPGLGGLDVFMSEFTVDGWTQPVNLGPPINSPADDFGIVYEPGRESGFFTSNRGRASTYDIYSFYLPPVEFMISGTVLDDSTGLAVPGAGVQLLGSDGTLRHAETNREGKYLFDASVVRGNTSYEILVNKPGYFSSRAQESTVGLERSQSFVVDLSIAPIPETAIELPEILYDFDSWALQPQFKDSLNGLVQTLFDNPRLVIELASHTDSRGTHEYNDTLSLRRARGVVEYLIAQGIAGERLVPVGYGKRNPRVIESTMERNGVTFEEGTVLTEEFINSLDGEKQQEIAHQMNRRTEFRVLSEDFEYPEEPETVPEPSNDMPEPERDRGNGNDRPPGQNINGRSRP